MSRDYHRLLCCCSSRTSKMSTRPRMNPQSDQRLPDVSWLCTLHSSSISSPSPLIVLSTVACASTCGGAANPQNLIGHCRWQLLNPASMKQALVEGASRISAPSMYEQGQGKLNLLASRVRTLPGGQADLAVMHRAAALAAICSMKLLLLMSACVPVSAPFVCLNPTCRAVLDAEKQW